MAEQIANNITRPELNAYKERQDQLSGRITKIEGRSTGLNAGWAILDRRRRPDGRSRDPSS